MCKIQIDAQLLIDVQSSNSGPFSISQTSVPHFSNSQIGVQFSNPWLFLTFSNRLPKTTLTSASNDVTPVREGF